ncbi:MAG: FkbM family methyltransferase [Phycisphaerales bacterium]|nr:FkbM family methyltransferase [Phycisphaerales bacterium]
MKPRNLVELLGLRSRPRTYGHEVVSYRLAADGEIHHARWKHPKESVKVIRQEEIDGLRTFLSQGDVAIDIGAHTGDSSIPMAVAVGEKGVVLALEPNPYVFKVLEENARLNPGHGTIVPLPYAATPQDGPIEFEYSDSGFCNGGRHEGISRWTHGHAYPLEVEGRHLPSLLKSKYGDLVHRIRFIKIDAEGYDHAVVRSVEPLVRRSRPVIRAEVFRHTSRESRIEFFDYLIGLNYDIHLHDNGHVPCGRHLSPEDVMHADHYDILCMPRKNGES